MTILNDAKHATYAGCVGCPNYTPNQCCHEPSSPEFDKEFDVQKMQLDSAKKFSEMSHIEQANELWGE